MKLLTIGEVAKRTGLRSSALRYFEACGVLPAPARRSGRRVYGVDIIRSLAMLRFAQQVGFTLAEIKTLLRGMDPQASLSARWQAMARKKSTELDARIQQMRRMRQALELSLKCGCARIEDCTLPSPDVRVAPPNVSRSNKKDARSGRS
jgi:MerR family transcriptional regulator, redox-sensitive transcriptional activator SoxR